MRPIDIETAAERINAAPGFSATVRGNEIVVSLNGRPAGIVTQDDLARIDYSATGWGKNLAKGAYPAWRAITKDGTEY